MLASRNANGTNGLVEALRQNNSTLVDFLPVGVDPFTFNNRGIVIARRIQPGLDPDHSYVVWDVNDWSYHPDKENRKRKTSVSRGSYRLTIAEAVRAANDRRMDLLLNYPWLIPGTDELVPGCRGSR